MDHVVALSRIRHVLGDQIVGHSVQRQTPIRVLILRLHCHDAEEQGTDTGRRLRSEHGEFAELVSQSVGYSVDSEPR